MSDEKKIIQLPDIGSYDNVDIIEIVVKIGDSINVEDTLIVLETDKATLDVPSTLSGVVSKILVKVGDTISQGDPILELLLNHDSINNQTLVKSDNITNEVQDVNNFINKDQSSNSSDNYQVKSQLSSNDKKDSINNNIIYAGPAVRKLARELGIDLNYVNGSGNKNRILAQDVKNYVKNNFKKNENLSDISPAKAGELDLLPWPIVDFTKYGKIESRKLSKIQKLSSMNLHRNWVKIPHVTQFADADFTESENFRKQLNNEWIQYDLKCSPLVFIIKAVTYALKTFPEFNSSLVNDEIILKKFYNIGFATDTLNGLVVPVITDADKKGFKFIAQELKDLSAKARSNKLSISEIQGSTFTISSLGGIGGNYFTPIINAPEVAILGICKNEIKPIYNGKEFIARLICPLSLSYDHRVIDGALACKFITYLSSLLSDIRKILV